MSAPRDTSSSVLEPHVELDLPGARQVRSSVTISVGACDYRIATWITLGDREPIGQIGTLHREGHAFGNFVGHPGGKIRVRIQLQRIRKISPALPIVGNGD